MLLNLELVFRASFNSSEGRASLIGTIFAIASGVMDEAEDLSDRRLPVRAVDWMDGSELAEE
jgi:hypothetical protein